MNNFIKKTAVLLVILAGGVSLFAQTKPIVKDDPVGREAYEIKRLVDPATGKVPENIRQRELEFAKDLPVGNLKSINALGWINRGPFNVGGRTRALAIDVNNENIILAGGVSGGMWRSDDGGTSWTKVTSPDQLQSVSAITQDTRAGHTNTWYYTTGELLGNSAAATGAFYNGDGVFKSEDNGQSWTHLQSTSTGTPEVFEQFFDFCWNVKVSPVNGYVFVATYGAIKRSKDEGEKWELVFNTDDALDNDYNYSSAVDIAVSSTGAIYASFDSDGDIHGFYRSDDSGDTWEDITPAGFPSTFGRTVIDIAPGNENVVYFLTYVSGSNASGHNLWKYVYDTANNKYTWTDLSGNIPDEEGKTGSFDSQGGYDLLVKIKPDDEKFVLIGGTDLWCSTDGFETKDNYTKIGGYKTSNNSYASYTNHHPDQHSIVFYPNNSKKVISGHDGGLSITNDITDTTTTAGETVDWTSMNAGYLTTQVYAVAMDMETDDDPVIISGFQDNGTYLTNTENAEGDWEKKNVGDGSFCAVADEGNSYFSSSQNGAVYREYENGKWTRVDPEGATGQEFINPFILDPNDDKMMYYPAGDVMWRNSDLTAIPDYDSDPATENWFKMTNTQVAGNQITALDVSDNISNILFFGTDSGEIYKVENANTGDPVKVDITGAGMPNANIGCVKVNPYDADEILISFTNYEVVSIWRTTDGGSTWESISGNLEENADGKGSGPSVRWVEILRNDDGSKIYFAGTSTGLYSTDNPDGDNTHWEQESPDMIGNIIVRMIKIRKDGTVIAGTHGNGVYSAKFDVSNSVRKNSIDEINARIYPNPSTGRFTVQATSNTPAVYRVIIFNMSGQAVFYSEQKNILDLNLNVDLSGQPEGVYNIQVMRGNEAFTYKLLLK
jgi:photosystem II stability/assembly factor-like uncharacterized protein